MTLATRFVSLAKNAKYRLANFEVIRQWTVGLGGAGAIAAAASDNDVDINEDEILDAEEDCVAAVTATQRKRIEVVVAAYDRLDAKIHLAACDQLFSHAIALIDLCCSTNTNGASAVRPSTYH